jgi:CBS domain-containing protein
MIVADLMTKTPIIVQPDTTLVDAACIMLAQHISGLPVQDEAGGIVGIITEGDLLRRPEIGTEGKERSWLKAFVAPGSLAADYVRTHGQHVGEVMTKSVVTVTPNTPLAEAAELMRRKRIKCLPVIEAERLVGIISRSDLLKALALKLIAVVSDRPTAESIRAYIIDTLARENWAPKSGIRVEVTGEVVTLKGIAADEAQRTALLIIAENAPGVKEVQNNITLEDPGDAVGF